LGWSGALRIGLVIDAACDLTRAQIEAHGIRVLPSMLEIGDRAWVDERAPEATMLCYRRFLADRAIAARARACSAAEIQELFLRSLVADYERVLVFCAGAEFSEAFQHATEASYAILQGYRERRDTTRPGGFALRVLDTGTLCAGEAVLVCRAVQLLYEQGQPFDQTRRALRDEAASVSCLLVPGDPWYLRRRGLDGAGRGLGMADALLARAPDVRPVVSIEAGRRGVAGRARGFTAACALAMTRAQEAIGRGLGTPALTLSFGGDPRVIREMPAYQDLEAQAVAARVDLHLAVMSATMGARLGPGALSIAWMNQAAAPA
jgi:fatty acid-binding protein DegV